MCACHVERSEAKSKHLPKDTIPYKLNRNDYLTMKVLYFCSFAYESEVELDLSGYPKDS